LLSDYAYRVTARAGARPGTGTLGAHGVPLAFCTGGSPAAALWRENSLDPRGFQSHAQATLRAFQQAWRASNAVRARDSAAAGADTWFWPVVQAGVLGLREEERAMGLVWDAVRDSGGEDVKVDLTSGYFGLYKAYKRAVIESPASVDIIAASPKVCLNDTWDRGRY
jgi:CDP-diacylglycerol--glycerol-3-phosphate 3-phosphatidyltransferase